MKIAGSMARIALCALLATALLATARPADAGDACLSGRVGALADGLQVAVARATIAAMCPCAFYDGSGGRTRGAYQKCARKVADTLVATGLLRSECRATLRRDGAASVCGRKPSAGLVPCVRSSLRKAAVSCAIKRLDRCVGRPGAYDESACTSATHCLDAADTNRDLRIGADDDGRCAPATPTPPPAFTPTPSPSPSPTPVPTATPPPMAPIPYPTGSGGTRLADLINDYRRAHGKAPIPITRTPAAVAGAHVYDLLANPNILTATCNLHSWSNNAPIWSGCCYDAAHSQAGCMWAKPSEISSSQGWPRYPGNGFEITYRGWFATPEMVIDFFDQSPGHRDVILNRGTWAKYDPWPAMGAAMRGDFAVVWFGDKNDPAN
jgi:hypothetical protein